MVASYNNVTGKEKFKFMSFSGVDENLVCVNCKKEFVFSAGEQAFYQRSFDNPTPPKRCKPCRDEKKAQRGDAGGSSPSGGNSHGGYSNSNGYPSNNAPSPTGTSYDEEGAGRSRKYGKKGRRDGNDWDND